MPLARDEVQVEDKFETKLEQDAKEIRLLINFRRLEINNKKRALVPPTCTPVCPEASSCMGVFRRRGTLSLY